MCSHSKKKKNDEIFKWKISQTALVSQFQLLDFEQLCARAGKKFHHFRKLNLKL